MPYDNKYTVEESTSNCTPSTASRIKAGPLENAFPTPPKRDTKQASVSRASGCNSPALSRILPLQRAASTPPEQTSHSHSALHRYREHFTGLPNSTDLEASWQRREVSKNTSQYFDEAFAVREPNSSAKERVMKDSSVIAEVRLNCCLEAHQDFLIDFSFQLSEIYQKSLSCVVVIVSTSVHMMLGGSSEPAYFMIITALPSEIAATKNKRTSHLLQSFMNETLHIPASRGIVRFNSVLEENLATNGMTALQEIEKIEHESHEEKGFARAISRQAQRMSKKSQAALMTDGEKAPTAFPESKFTSNCEQLKMNEKDDFGPLGFSMSIRKKMKSRKSIMAFFKIGKSESAC